MKCIKCNRQPHEIGEYIDAAEKEPEYFDSPEDFVKQEEGTYNHTNGHFWCTKCYVSAGMPLGVAP